MLVTKRGLVWEIKLRGKPSGVRKPRPGYVLQIALSPEPARLCLVAGWGPYDNLMVSGGHRRVLYVQLPSPAGYNDLRARLTRKLQSLEKRGYGLANDEQTLPPDFGGLDAANPLRVLLAETTRFVRPARARLAPGAVEDCAGAGAFDFD